MFIMYQEDVVVWRRSIVAILLCATVAGLSGCATLTGCGAGAAAGGAAGGGQGAAIGALIGCTVGATVDSLALYTPAPSPVYVYPPYPHAQYYYHFHYSYPYSPHHSFRPRQYHRW